MNNPFRIPPLAIAMLAATTATAETLSPIIVQDELVINPATSEPEEYARSKGTPADGGEFLRQINGVNMSRFGGRGLELDEEGLGYVVSQSLVRDMDNLATRPGDLRAAQALRDAAATVRGLPFDVDLFAADLVPHGFSSKSTLA